MAANIFLLLMAATVWFQFFYSKLNRFRFTTQELFSLEIRKRQRPLEAFFSVSLHVKPISDPLVLANPATVLQSEIHVLHLNLNLM